MKTPIQKHLPLVTYHLEKAFENMKYIDLLLAQQIKELQKKIIHKYLK